MMILDPYRFGVAAVTGTVGALVARTSTDTNTGAVPWQTEVRDEAGAYDSGVSTTELTVPSGYSYGRVIGYYSSTTPSASYELMKDSGGGATTFSGHARERLGHSAGNVGSLVSAIVAVAAGEKFTLNRDASIQAQANTWLSIELFPSDWRFCSARRSATQAIAAGTTTVMAFDAGVAESESIHAAGTFTIPGDAQFIRGACSMRGSESAGASNASQFVITMLVGGALVNGSLSKDCARSDATNSLSGISAIIPVSGGEAVTFTAFATNAQNIGGNNSTWGTVEILPNDVEFCTLYKAATQGLAAGVAENIEWGSTLHTTNAGFHVPATDNTKIVNPAGSGFTQARVSFGVRGPSATGIMQARALHNGNFEPGLAWDASDTPGADSINGFGDWIAFPEGDYFQISVTHASAVTLGTDTPTWVCVEFR